MSSLSGEEIRATRTSAERSIDVLAKTKSSIGKLAGRLIAAREHIEWCHKALLDCFTPIWSDDFEGLKGCCHFMGLDGWRGPQTRHCNHRPSRDNVCGQHWNIVFGHEWNFTGAAKYGNDLEFPAHCSLCGVRRSKATATQKCSKKGERQWLKNELEHRRSLL